MPLLRPAVLVLAAVALLPGCAGAPGADEASGERKGTKMADDVVHEQAEELAGDLRGVAWLEQAVYLDLQVPLQSRDDWTQTEITRQLLVSEDSTGEDGEPVFHLVARIWVHVIPGNTSDWFPPGEASVARCFAYEVRRDDAVEPEETDCPDVEPIQVDTSIRVPEQPRARPVDDAAVRDFLRQGGVAGDLELPQARLGRGLTAKAMDEGGVTAVAVTAQPDGADCVLGRRGPRGKVDVWHPDRILTMAGEMGCEPALVTHPPL